MELLTSYPFEFSGWKWLGQIPRRIGNFNDSSWSFAFHRKGDSDVHVYLKITSSNSAKCFAIISSFRILYENSHHQKECYLKYITDGETNAECHFTLKYLKLKLVEVSGSITVLQLSDSVSKEIQMSKDSLTDRIPSSVENIIPSPLLSDDFLRLLNNPDSFPDATLKCGAEEIPVHKNILSVRSSVFAAMFTNEMREGSSGVVEIVDIEPNVLQATLKYVYSGKTDHLDDEIAGDVLFAANKYQLEELKKVCIQKLKSCMTVDNVFRILVLGDLHDESLKSQAKEFVCKCDKFINLQKTEGWKLLQSEYPGLAMEVLMCVVNFAQK